jgi:proline iminopeptidase
MKRALKWGGGTVGALMVAILAIFIATHGEHSVPPLVTDDASLPSREVAGVALHMSIAEGPPEAQTIVVLHGGAGGDFRSLLALEALSDTHRVVLYDQRGAGLSERVTAERLTLNGYLKELHEIIEMTSPGAPVILIGHSWGAMLASAYLGEHPDQVDRAILIEPGYIDADGKVAWEAQAARYMAGAGYALEAVLNGFRAAHVTGPDAQASDDFLIGRMVGVFADHPHNPYHCGGGYSAPGWRFGALASAQWRDAPATDLDRIAKGAAYPGSVLFIAGSCNDWTGAPLQTRHAARFANAEVTVIPEAGHDVIWDNAEVALAEIRQFLAANR